MTPIQIQLVRSSWAPVKPIQEPAAAHSTPAGVMKSAATDVAPSQLDA